MHFVYPNLAEVMKSKGMGYKDVAVILNIGEFAAYRRLRGIVGWRLPEVFRLSEYFDSDPAWLFKRL